MKNISLIIFFAASLFIKSLFCQTEPDNLLLKNYRPKSIYNIPITRIEKAKFPVIDMHSHPYASGNEIDLFVKNMDEAGIIKTILLTHAHGGEFDSLVNFYSKYPDRFELWCGFDYTGYDKPGYGPNAVEELVRCFKMGAKGVGELGDKGKGLFYCKPPAWGMHIDDPKMDPLLQKCAELNMPINIHVGEPQWFYEKMDSTNDGLLNAFDWRLDNQEGLDLDSVLKTLENAVKKHPGTIFIACHLANQNTDLNKLGVLLDKYANLYADISARYAENAPVPRYTKAFFEKYQDKLLYGTDMGFEKSMYETTFRILESLDEHFYNIELFNYHWPLNGFGLNDETLEKLYKKNAEKILRINRNK
ncbi:MAG TPA: amidohydrolase family protein, partial [Ignavibacteriaceae bacterium]|nr:amidohydrolase family protein [Ignavibacteriaceae bacterium]